MRLVDVCVSVALGDVDLKDGVRSRGCGIGFGRRHGAVFVAADDHVHDFLNLNRDEYLSRAVWTIDLHSWDDDL